MGMSNDFEVAIEEGSNLVRVGSAIFGEREMIEEPEDAAESSTEDEEGLPFSEITTEKRDRAAR
jgi:hypothetical protein